jgi:hypothetical protein
MSIIRFIHHIFQFCSSKPNWNIQLSCDNDPLVKRVEAARPYDQCFPNVTLEADWDVVNMIVRTIHQSSCNIILQHVKGHQDDKKSYDDLPLDAQLNCDADYEAVYFQTVHANYRPLVPRIPLNLAQLHIDGATINSGYKTAIRNAYSEPALRASIQSSNSWTAETMQSINFQSHKQALDRMSSRHIQLVKLCHDILPTAKITHRYNPIASKLCPLCKSETEDFPHLLRCTHPDRKPWRHKLYAALRATCELHDTRPYLVDLLLNGIDAWFHGVPLDPSKYPRIFHRLIREQTAIGWRQIFQGRMTSEWARLQDNHLRDIKALSNFKSGTLWTTTIITTTWKSFFTMWEARNAVVHGADTSTRQQARRDHAAISLRHLHTKQDDVLATDRKLFISDCPKALDHWVNTHTATYIENWLKIWKPVIIDSAKAAQAFAIKSVLPLREYFSPTYTPPSSRRPPKPRYKPNAHTVHDRQKPKKKRKPVPPLRNHSILAFFKRQPTPPTTQSGSVLRPAPALPLPPETPPLVSSTIR